MIALRPADLFCMKAIGVFFASVGGMLLVQFPSYYRSEAAFEANKVSVTGTVVETREKQEYSGGGGILALTVTTKYVSTVEFHTRRGDSIKFITSNACSSQQDCENKAVQVQYDPSVPNKARINSNTTLNTRVGGYGVLSLIFFLIGIGLLVVDPGDGSTRPNE